MSLRAKVTGVTVAVLVIGLATAGAVSTPILRNILLGSVDSTLQQYVQTNIAERLLQWKLVGDRLEFGPTDQQPRTDYIVAIYDADGDLRAFAGGQHDLDDRPILPARFPLEDAYIQTGSIISLPSIDGHTFHATVSVRSITVGTYDQPITQLVAMSLSDVSDFVTTYVTVFSLVSIVIVIAAAYGTRWLVTLTFRRLRRVENTAMEIAAGNFSQRMTDIVPSTEIGRLKVAINTMLDRIDGAIEERDATLDQMRRFIGDASHELRTPLVSVRGYAELYRMGALADDDAVGKAMERIEAEAKRMGMLVEDLLALTRLEEAKELELVPVDLRPIARDAAMDLRATEPERAVVAIDHTHEQMTQPIDLPIAAPDDLAGEADERRVGLAQRASSVLREAGFRGPTWRRRTAPAPERMQAPEREPAPDERPTAVQPVPDRATPMPPVVAGDENRIRQVVANLIGNARRYTPARAPIEIEVGAEGKHGWIAVVDHGDGIPEAIRGRIFERFWRADTSRTRETGGSGLGLAIVASIVTALRGSVSVEETPGGGATFRVSLPLAEYPELDADDESPRPQPQIAGEPFA